MVAQNIPSERLLEVNSIVSPVSSCRSSCNFRSMKQAIIEGALEAIYEGSKRECRCNWNEGGPILLTPINSTLVRFRGDKDVCKKIYCWKAMMQASFGKAEPDWEFQCLETSTSTSTTTPRTSTTQTTRRTTTSTSTTTSTTTTSSTTEKESEQEQSNRTDADAYEEEQINSFWEALAANYDTHFPELKSEKSEKAIRKKSKAGWKPEEAFDLKLRVRDHKGRPVPGAKVVTVKDDEVMSESGETDSEGMTHAMVGNKAVLEFTHPNYNPSSLPFDVAADCPGIKETCMVQQVLSSWEY